MAAVLCAMSFLGLLFTGLSATCRSYILIFSRFISLAGGVFGGEDVR